MTPAVIRRIVTRTIPRAWCLKHEDWPGLEKISQLRALRAATARCAASPILIGNNALFLDFEMERGADGANTGYCFPDMLVDVVRLSNAGRRDEAHDLFDAHLPLIRYEQQPGPGLAVRKYVMMRRGIIACDTLRKPGAALTRAARAEVDYLLARRRKTGSRGRESGGAMGNAFSEPWTGPYGGVPPFDAWRSRTSGRRSRRRWPSSLREIERIAARPAAPDLREHDRRARARRAARSIAWRASTASSARTMSTPAFQEVEREMAPKLAAFSDRIIQNEKLFARIAAVCRRARERPAPHARAAAPRLARLHGLRAQPARSSSPAAKKRARRDQPAPRRRSTRSSARTCSPTRRTTSLCLESEARPRRPARVRPRRGGRGRAEPAGSKGKWAILNTRSCMEPFLTYSERRDLREKVWRTFYSRGDNGDAHDNNKRDHRDPASCAPSARKLLGYPTHAHWRLEDTMAKTPERAHGADGSGVEAGGRARARGGRRHAGDRRHARAPASRSSRGTTATTPRRCARRSTTSTRTR